MSIHVLCSQGQSLGSLPLLIELTLVTLGWAVGSRSPADMDPQKLNIIIVAYFASCPGKPHPRPCWSRCGATKVRAICQVGVTQADAICRNPPSPHRLLARILRRSGRR